MRVLCRCACSGACTFLVWSLSIVNSISSFWKTTFAVQKYPDQKSASTCPHIDRYQVFHKCSAKLCPATNQLSVELPAQPKGIYSSFDTGLRYVAGKGVWKDWEGWHHHYPSNWLPLSLMLVPACQTRCRILCHCTKQEVILVKLVRHPKSKKH